MKQITIDFFNKNKIKEFTLEALYEYFYKTPSDMNEHLPVLKEYAEKCDSIIEMGFRTAVSAIGLLAGKPKSMIDYDIMDNWNGIKYKDIVEDIVEIESLNWKFEIANVLYIDIEPVDFLFIDTLHTYTQLSKELAKHSDKVKKYIGFHDIVSFGRRGEDGSPKGLMNAIEEFLSKTSDWNIEIENHNCNGLMILKRV
jgi:hypothetical protein